MFQFCPIFMKRLTFLDLPIMFCQENFSPLTFSDVLTIYLPILFCQGHFSPLTCSDVLTITQVTGKLELPFASNNSVGLL